MRKFIILFYALLYGVLFGIMVFLTRPAHAAFFNPVPFTLVNGTTGLSAQVNSNYNAIVADGNAANTNLLAQIAALTPRGFPAGAVIAFNQAACPEGFALANATTGRPDVRGVYIRGLDAGAGRDPGRVLASYQADQIQDHFHGSGGMSQSFNYILVGTITSPFGFRIPDLAFTNPPIVGQMSAGGLSETRPVSVVYNYCVVTSLVPVSSGAPPFSPPPQTLSNLIAPDADIMMIDYNRIISDGNTTFNALQAAITAVSSVPLPPAGAVVPFNLTVCPTGWVASNGTGGTVDMRGRFARITVGTPAVGTIQTNQFIDHTHSIAGVFLAGLTGSSGSTSAPPVIQIAVTSLRFDALILGAIGANVGTETRPKNVALLYCQKS